MALAGRCTRLLVGEGFPDWTLAHARGQVITVDGRPAKLLHGRGAGSDIGADVSVVDDNRDRLQRKLRTPAACARQPGAGTAERSADRMPPTTDDQRGVSLRTQLQALMPSRPTDASVPKTTRAR